MIVAFYSATSVISANAVNDSVPQNITMQKGIQANHIASDGSCTVADIEMVTVPGGSYQMGSNDGFNDEKPVHTVDVKSFKLGKYEVTQSQWVSVMGKNPSNFKGANKPVDNVSWHDVQIFIRKLNIRTGQQFRLPSEAEWEYAARAGTNSGVGGIANTQPAAMPGMPIILTVNPMPSVRSVLIILVYMICTAM